MPTPTTDAVRSRPPPSTAGSQRRPRPHLVDRAGRRRVRGHPPHGAALRGARADLARAPGHGSGLPPARPHPARPDPARQAARVPARGDPHDHRPLRRPARAAQPARVRARARSTSAAPTSSSAAATSTRPCPSSPSSSAAAAPTSTGSADRRPHGSTGKCADWQALSPRPMLGSRARAGQVACLLDGPGTVARPAAEVTGPDLGSSGVIRGPRVALRSGSRVEAIRGTRRSPPAWAPCPGRAG